MHAAESCGGDIYTTCNNVGAWGAAVDDLDAATSCDGDFDTDKTSFLPSA